LLISRGDQNTSVTTKKLTEKGAVTKIQHRKLLVSQFSAGKNEAPESVCYSETILGRVGYRERGNKRAVERVERLV
jgi:hypothetical protein